MSEVGSRFAKTSINCDVHGAVEVLAGWPICGECAEQRRVAEAAARQAKQEAAARTECIESALKASGLVGRFLTATLDTFEVSDSKRRAALRAARLFADAVGAPEWRVLWLIGTPGTGKTHLASGIVRHVIEQHYPLTAAIRTVGEIIAEHRSLWDPYHREQRRAHNETIAREGGSPSRPTTTDELAAWLGSRSLLVIDDLGATRLGDAELEILFNVVDLRYRACRPTVITSNLPARDLAEQLGLRLTDRLQERATIVPCAWPSRRPGPLNRTPA